MNLSTGMAGIAVACVALGCSGKLAPARTAPAAPGTQAQAGGFAGTYESNWGDTVFTQAGSTVNATYPTGTMSCTAMGAELHCDWAEGSTQGKARLTRQSDGSIRGSWGSGASSSNGGPWVFTPKAGAVQAVPAASGSSSCQKDNDCSGDLVCINGQCKPL